MNSKLVLLSLLLAGCASDRPAPEPAAPEPTAPPHAVKRPEAVAQDVSRPEVRYYVIADT
jgi:hypothetical protein